MKKTEKRKLYKIGHLTKLLGITSRTIRYYDQFGLLPHVKRSDGNVRLFNDEDVDIIKRIRFMQKEEFLPLDIIKERLFGSQENLQQSEAIVVTDSISVLPEGLDSNLPISTIPVTIKFGTEEVKLSSPISPQDFSDKTQTFCIQPKIITPSIDQLIKHYLKLYDQGYKRVYSVHVSSKLSDVYQHAYEASLKVSDKIEVIPIDTKSTGPGSGLFIKRLAEAINSGESREKIDILISKELPLIYTLFTLNGFSHMVDKNYIDSSNNFQRNVLTKLQDFKPVLGLQNGYGNLEVIDCKKSLNDVNDLLEDIIEEEVRSRGGYLSEILVIYHYLYAEAGELTNRLKSIYPKATIVMMEDQGFLSLHLGPESMAISIV